MKEKHIMVVDEFHPRPYGRYAKDCTTCNVTAGEVFRDKMLVPAMNNFDKVTVDLTGYNRYGRSFLDEAFGGLINECGFTKVQLDEKLKYIHHDLDLVIQIIDDRINNAEINRKK